MLSLLFFPPHQEDSSHSSPFPAWGPSHGRQSSMNLPKVSPSRRVQFFRNTLLQHGSPKGSQVLPANLFQHRLPLVSQPLLDIHLLWCGVLHGLQVEICSTMDLHGLQGHSLPHHGLFHGLQGNLCSSTWSTSSASFFTDLGVCRVISLMHSHSSPSTAVPQQVFCLLQRITQNHRMVGVGRDLCGSSSPTLLPKQGHLQ